MKILTALDEGAKKPKKAYKADAGYDLFTPEDFDVPPAGHKGDGKAVMDTGVHMAIPEGYFGYVCSKSGLNIYKDLTAEGIIDSGYTGSIVVKLYNHGKERRSFRAGDKIAQIIFIKHESPELILVDSLPETERGNNGFGSTGR
ncbi:MAG: dUTP diphosphatase [Lachnospiraceae bacterium]|nr:dUTP diphosphatase [Eubacterium sp.]MBR3164813.1 dUTP diphosphatase [Lachnospiraceae bacterium]MBR3187256.1 dUTP diphosphatase [Lachnospiraceae bacterium]